MQHTIHSSQLSIGSLQFQKYQWGDHIDVTTAGFHLVWNDVKTLSVTTPASVSSGLFLFGLIAHHISQGYTVEWRVIWEGNTASPVALGFTNATDADNASQQIMMPFGMNVSPSTTYSVTLQARNNNNAGQVFTNGGQFNDSGTNVAGAISELTVVYL